MKVAGAIIAGGPAKRLGGVAKPFLEVGGRTIAERQLALLRGAALVRVFVVANDPAPWAALGVDVVPDLVGGAGPLGGIQAALNAADGCDAVICLAGDLPFVGVEVVETLRDRAPWADAVAPRTARGIEPLCARYARALLPAVDACVRDGALAVHEMLERRAVDWITEAELAALDPEGRSFINVNTPEDLARADALAAGETGPRP
ncbi:MAG TPA: molybdenum cofactor guanylyltransferase [Polyangia bacterium]|jgi:molybdopterin-guanine dinucleotide biosynthesis protein A|nr:molybdenum cofactor guanylyltransferase [Polyangia bacterium]